MKNSKNWLRTNLGYGLVVIVPLAVVLLLLAKLVELLQKAAAAMELESALGAGLAVFQCVFDHRAVDRRLVDHAGEIEGVHVGHAAAGMAAIEVAAEQIELRFGGPGFAWPANQIAVPRKHPALGPAWLECAHGDADRHACRAAAR